jgi:hypothetical protein
MRETLRFIYIQDGTTSMAALEFERVSEPPLPQCSTSSSAALQGGLSQKAPRRARRRSFAKLAHEFALSVTSDLFAAWLLACAALYAPYLPALVDLLVRFSEQVVSVDLGAVAREVPAPREAAFASRSVSRGEPRRR